MSSSSLVTRAPQLPTLGHAAFMGVGAYTTAILAARAGLPFWLALPAGGAAACLAGMVVGVPSLRIKGLYLAIATLAAQVIFEWAFSNWTGLTGGIRGINVPPAEIAARNNPTMITPTRAVRLFHNLDSSAFIRPPPLGRAGCT